MAITIDDVEHILNLARLTLGEEEKKKFTHQLAQILDHAGEISKLNLENIPPTSHSLSARPYFREDSVDSTDEMASIWAQAPEAEAHFFKVPGILGQTDES